MNSSTSILEIRKANFIKNPNYDNYRKLVEKIDRHKEIFDNKFFAKVKKNALLKKDTNGLLYISQLYIVLNRNIEAEFILSCAYEIDKTNSEILYYYFDILCRRKQLGFISSVGDKLEKFSNKLMYDKCLIKYFLLTRKSDKLMELIKSTFEKHKTDNEFVRLVFISAIQNDNYNFTYMVSKTNFRQELFRGLSGSVEMLLKNHFSIMIINLLRKKVNGNQSC